MENHKSQLQNSSIPPKKHPESIKEKVLRALNPTAPDSEIAKMSEEYDRKCELVAKKNSSSHT